MRTGFRFSGGAKVRASNFAYAIDRVLSPTLQSFGAGYFEDIVGARAVEDGKAKHVRGVKVIGNTLSIRLTRPAGDFLARLTSLYLCPVPLGLPIAGGVNVPPPGSGPYFIAKWTPNRQLVLKRNPFYRGGRPHHLAQFVATIGDDPDTIRGKIERSQVDWGCGLDYGCLGADIPPEAAADLAKKYGVNRRKGRFFVQPDGTLYYLALNTQRPLFRNNVALRRAINFALDRPALVRARGLYWGSPTEGYLPLGMPSAPTVHRYPLKHPNLAKARHLARGHTRSGRAILYASDLDVQTVQAHIVQRNLKAIGIRVTIKQFPFTVLYEKAGTRGEPFDMALEGWYGDFYDPWWYINPLFDGREITAHGNNNWAYFNVPRYNRLMAKAASLSGPSHYHAYGELALVLARDATPYAVFGERNARLLVSKRVGCTVFGVTFGGLDLAAACLK